jgi:hypothetical protein
VVVIRPRAASATQTGLPPGTDAPAQPQPATLRVSVEPKIEEASLTMWLDDHLILERQLEPTSKKKFLLFGRAGKKQSQSINIVPGQHSIRVRVRSSTSEESYSLQRNFTEASKRVLIVTFANQNEMKARLK